LERLLVLQPKQANGWSAPVADIPGYGLWPKNEPASRGGGVS
jgi:hypothetical protein